MKLHTLLQFCLARDKDGRNLVHGLPFTPAIAAKYLRGVLDDGLARAGE
jgi:hypothetical protein